MPKHVSQDIAGPATRWIQDGVNVQRQRKAWVIGHADSHIQLRRGPLRARCGVSDLQYAAFDFDFAADVRWLFRRNKPGCDGVFEVAAIGPQDEIHNWLHDSDRP